MKARLIKNADQRYVILGSDGTIAAANDQNLFDFLTGFRTNDGCFAGTNGRWDAEYPDMTLYPGETMAFIADNSSLVVYNFQPFALLLNSDVRKFGFLTTQEFAERHNRSIEIIKAFCRDGRIPGAKKVGGIWLIPKEAEYPVDESYLRPNSGKRARKK